MPELRTLPYPTVIPLPEPVAHWNFAASEPFTSRAAEALTLCQGIGSAVSIVDDERFGRVARFDGQRDYLVLPALGVGALNVGRTTGRVTVMAWVRRASPAIGFVAGMWQENDTDPRRQYGLFVNLDSYGGKDRVVGHVSHTGAASPGLPYSRDCSASARMLGYGQWRHVAFTYDGVQAVSYLDGQADALPDYTEPVPPIGAELSYTKNPYRFPDGLNYRAVSDFTVGAVRLTTGMGNFFGGDLAQVTVYDEALTPEQVAFAALAGSPASEPAVMLDFYRTTEALPASSGAWPGAAWPLSLFGWREHPPASDGPRFTVVRDGERSRVVRASGDGPTTVVFAPLHGLMATSVTIRVEGLGDGVSVLAQANGSWFETGHAEADKPGPAPIWRLADLDAPDAAPSEATATSLPEAQLTGIGLRVGATPPGAAVIESISVLRG